LAKEQTIVSGMAGRYAVALFELAKESKVTDQIAADLQRFSDMVAGSDDLRRFLRSPVFSAEAQVAALTAILNQAGIAGLSANFLKLVAQKRRLFAVADMIRNFNALNDAEKGIARAEVTVAEPLKETHVTALKEAIHAIAGGRTVEIATKVDPSILGGLIVQFGSRMVDGSLKTKLDMIRTRMKEVG
jgi:F-type H+-transporting ATPase subunit delta